MRHAWILVVSLSACASAPPSGPARVLEPVYVELEPSTPLLHPAEPVVPRFAVGTLVSDRELGVVEIVGLEHRQLAGERRPVYRLRQVDFQVRVLYNTPLEQLLEVPLRPLLSREDADAIVARFATRLPETRPASQLARALDLVRQCDDPYSRAAVVHEVCSGLDRDVDGYRDALRRLVQELGVVLSRSPTEVMDLLVACHRPSLATR